MTALEKLDLTVEQESAFDELEKCLKKCKEVGMAFVTTLEGCYAINDKDVYDIDASYDDYSVEEVNTTELRRTSMKIYPVGFDHIEKCPVSFFSTTFTDKGITH